MTPTTTASPTTSRRDRGFTLVEILIAIVLVGILSAVVVVGISNLTEKGSQSACTASLDASKAAAVVHFTNAGIYPATFAEMTAATPPSLTLPSDVTVVSPVALQGQGWTLTLTPGVDNQPPTFACS
jgi:prepilin-type N-terminal cleavage/methylation domain-containing protein